VVLAAGRGLRGWSANTRPGAGGCGGGLRGNFWGPRAPLTRQALLFIRLGEPCGRGRECTIERLLLQYGASHRRRPGRGSMASSSG